MNTFLQLLLSFFIVALNRANGGSFDHQKLYSIGIVSITMISRGVTATSPGPQTYQYYDSKMVKVTKNIETEEFNFNLTKLYLECLIETHLNPNLLIRFVARIWENNSEIKEWTLCVLCKMELMTPQGVYRYDTALTKIPKNDKKFFDEIIDRCLIKSPEPPREIAWEYLKCIDYYTKRAQPKVARLGIFYM